MKKIVLGVTLLALAAPGFAQDEKATATESNPMSGWVPRKVTNEKADKTEITALFKAMEAAEKKGDLNAAAALVDFPVLMVTDDSKGEAKAESWTRERWMELMEPFYKKPMPDMKVTHKPAIFMVTDSLASVGDQFALTMGKKSVTGRSSTLLVRKGGKWLIKSMMEGGWGDWAKQHPAEAAAQPTAPSDTASQPAETQETPQTAK